MLDVISNSQTNHLRKMNRNLKRISASGLLLHAPGLTVVARPVVYESYSVRDLVNSNLF